MDCNLNDLHQDEPHAVLAKSRILCQFVTVYGRDDDRRDRGKSYGDDGYLVYSFAEVVAALHPYYVIRVAGGLLYFAGAIFMVWNIWMTIAGKLRDEAPLTGAAYDPVKDRPIVAAAASLPLAAE